MSNNGNGTQVAVEFEDESEKVTPSKEEERKHIRRMEVLAEGYRYELARIRQKLARALDSGAAEKRRAEKAELECVFLIQRLNRVPKPIRGLFDRIHRIRRAWRYVTSTSQA